MILINGLSEPRAVYCSLELQSRMGYSWKIYALQAQQAAEKALKAVLWLKDEEPPHIHDIATLLKLSPEW
jgi:HEPN domain-containing protein